MLSNLNNSEIVFVGTCLLIIVSMSCLDRYLTRRKSAALNTDYLRRRWVEASDFGYIEEDFNSETPASDVWLGEVRFDLNDARFVNQRYFLSDRNGRVVAINVEEITNSDNFPKSERLLLAQPQPLKLLQAA